MASVPSKSNLPAWTVPLGVSRCASQRLVCAPSHEGMRSFRTKYGRTNIHASTNASPPKNRLLKLINTHNTCTGDTTNSQHVAKLIGELERNAPTVAKEELDAALSGTWKLLFYSGRENAFARTVRVLDVTQILNSEGNTLENVIRFSWRPWLPTIDPIELSGTLRIVCHVQRSGTALQLTLQRRAVRFDQREDDAHRRLPADMKHMLADLARAVPRAVYEPTGTTVATYIDSELRVTCTSRGTRLVFVRSASVNPIPTAAAQVRLLRLLPALINNARQADKVRSLLAKAIAEGASTLCASSDVNELALRGTWRLFFSSSPPIRGGRGSVRVRSMYQQIGPNRALINAIQCVWFGAPHRVPLLATMHVLCTYQFVAPNRIVVKLKEHTLRFDPRADGLDGKLPVDLAPMLGDLRAAVPVDFFDPSGLVEITTLDTEFRSMRYLGKRIAGVQNVFVGVHTSTPFPTSG